MVFWFWDNHVAAHNATQKIHTARTINFAIRTVWLFFFNTNIIFPRRHQHIKSAQMIADDRLHRSLYSRQHDMHQRVWYWLARCIAQDNCFVFRKYKKLIQNQRCVKEKENKIKWAQV